MPTETITEELAASLFSAFETGAAIEPLSETHPDLDIDAAYAIQRRVLELHREKGREAAGSKIGLTSPGIQQQLGVDSPDYGVILDSHVFPSGSVVSIGGGAMIAPRIEAELAFVLARPLQGPGITAEEVLDATERIVPVFELIDSRVADWRIKLVDTVADNASFYGVVPAASGLPLADVGDLAAVSMAIEHDGEQKLEGTGAAVLGHPAEAVAWLANELGRFGDGLAAERLIMSGSFGPAIDLIPGHYRATFSGGLPDVEVTVQA